MSFLAIIWQMFGLFLTLSYHIYHILQKTWNTAHKSCAPLLWYDKVESIIGAEFLGELFLRKLQGSQIKNNKTRSKKFWKPQKYDTKKLIRNCGLWSLNRKMHCIYKTLNRSLTEWETLFLHLQPFWWPFLTFWPFVSSHRLTTVRNSFTEIFY